MPVPLTSKFGYYTKEPFTEDNQKELANEVSRLQKLGGHVMLTNSNQPLVHELYQKYKLTVVLSHRSLSSKGASRGSEDVIVTAKPFSGYKLAKFRGRVELKIGTHLQCEKGVKEN